MTFDPLTVDLLTSKWGDGSPVSCASLVPIFSMLPFLTHVSGTGQTDSQRSSLHIAPPYGDGSIKSQ